MFKLKTILIPLLISLSFFLAYHLLPKVHLVFWLILMFSYGIWFPIIVLKITKYFSKEEQHQNKIGYFLSAILLFILTLLYMSKYSEFGINFRSITFLFVNGIGHFLLLNYFLKTKIRFLDFAILILYGTVLNIALVERDVNMVVQFDYFIGIWIFLFLFHYIQILNRD